MPKCKNDESRSYKGTEPSPKGKGYCAHAEKLNSKKKGKDGNMWIVKKTSNGSKRWIKESKKKSKKSKIENIDHRDVYEYDIKPKQYKLIKKNKIIKKIFDEIRIEINKLLKKSNINDKIYVVPFIHLENEGPELIGIYPYNTEYLDKYYKNVDENDLFLNIVFSKNMRIINNKIVNINKNKSITFYTTIIDDGFYWGLRDGENSKLSKKYKERIKNYNKIIKEMKKKYKFLDNIKKNKF